MKRGKQGLPGGRPHRLGDLVRDGPEISSHVDRSSLGGRKVLRITISMQPDDIVTFEQVFLTWHSSISFTTCSSASASCLAKGCTTESVSRGKLQENFFLSRLYLPGCIFFGKFFGPVQSEVEIAAPVVDLPHLHRAKMFKVWTKMLEQNEFKFTFLPGVLFSCNHFPT